MQGSAHQRRSKHSANETDVQETIQEQLERSLQNDRKLQAIHVEVHNLSRWYDQRHKLGARYHMNG